MHVHCPSHEGRGEVQLHILHLRSSLVTDRAMKTLQLHSTAALQICKLESISHIKASPQSAVALTLIPHNYEVLALLLGTLNPLGSVFF